MLNMDFEAEIDEILKAVPKERRTFLFSATMTSKVAKLQRACLKNPVKVGGWAGVGGLQGWSCWGLWGGVWVGCSTYPETKKP